MKHIAFDPRFVNAAGNDLIPGKIHTIRVNYDFWKRFEGQEVALFTWAGKPYGKGSKHKVFCVKRLVSVQKVYVDKFRGEIIALNVGNNLSDYRDSFLDVKKVSKNDGFEHFNDFNDWFADYKPGKMAILHFTDYRY